MTMYTTCWIGVVNVGVEVTVGEPDASGATPLAEAGNATTVAIVAITQKIEIRLVRVRMFRAL